MTPEQEKQFEEIYIDAYESGLRDQIPNYNPLTHAMQAAYELGKKDGKKDSWNAAVERCAETAECHYVGGPNPIITSKFVVDKSSILKNRIPDGLALDSTKQPKE